MKLVMQLGLCCLLASGAFAQRRGGGGFHAGVPRGGFGGGGIARGGGHFGGIRGGFGGIRGGFGYRGFGYRGFGYRHFRGLYSYWPWYYGGYYWPSYWDSGFWDWPYDYDYGDYVSSGYGYNPYAYGGGNVTVVYPPPAEPVYTPVVTQPARPVVREYRGPEDYGLPSEHKNYPILYLIAFKDHVIRAAMTYWVTGGVVHYVDLDHKEKQAPLSSVDQDFSNELNRERHVPFSLQ
jgi:hypothetical protein